MSKIVETSITYLKKVCEKNKKIRFYLQSNLTP